MNTGYLFSFFVARFFLSTRAMHKLVEEEVRLEEEYYSCTIKTFSCKVDEYDALEKKLESIVKRRETISTLLSPEDSIECSYACKVNEQLREDCFMLQDAYYRGKQSTVSFKSHLDYCLQKYKL